jgi:hypothetical protein
MSAFRGKADMFIGLIVRFHFVTLIDQCDGNKPIGAGATGRLQYVQNLNVVVLGLPFIHILLRRSRNLSAVAIKHSSADHFSPQGLTLGSPG